MWYTGVNWQIDIFTHTTRMWRWICCFEFHIMHIQYSHCIRFTFANGNNNNKWNKQSGNFKNANFYAKKTMRKNVRVTPPRHRPFEYNSILWHAFAVMFPGYDVVHKKTDIEINLSDVRQGSEQQQHQQCDKNHFDRINLYLIWVRIT